MKLKNQNILITTLFIIYLMLLTGVILFKLPFYSETLYDVRVINPIPFQGSFDENGAILLREIIYNVLLFVPLGIYICTLKIKWPFIKKVFLIIGLTLAFEAVQFIFSIGRSDITDVLGNTLGGIIGIALHAVLLKIFKSKSVKIVNMLALVVTVCVVSRFTYLFYLSHFVMGHPPR